MKKLSLGISTVALAAALVTPHVQSSSYAENICAYVEADDKKGLRSYLRSNKLKVRNIFSGIQCNGSNLLAYADTHNAVETGSYLVGRMSKKVLVNYVTGLKAGPIATAAQERVGN